MKRIMSFVLSLILLFSVNSVVLAANDRMITSVSNYAIEENTSKLTAPPIEPNTGKITISPTEPITSSFSTTKTYAIKGVIQWFGYAIAAEKVLEGEFSTAINVVGISTFAAYILTLCDM